MTNGEKFKEIFEVSQVDEGDYFAFVWFNHNAAEFSIDWWNAEYKEPKTGHWIKITPSGIYMCSECEQNVLTGDIDAYHHCHHCGIKMINVPDKNDGKLSEIPTGSESEDKK